VTELISNQTNVAERKCQSSSSNPIPWLYAMYLFICQNLTWVWPKSIPKWTPNGPFFQNTIPGIALIAGS